jgi:MoaA/NifB/PqqE/SkfB family radical SAM enzyme
MNSVYFSITNKCNLGCRHCSYDCRPDGKTMPEEDRDAVIDHLPRTLKSIIISGGEVFYDKPALLQTLGYMQSKGFPGLKVYVQTNGFWVKDEESVYKTMKELVDLGVSDINFASNDKFHEEQGIKPGKLSGNPNTPLGKALRRINNQKTRSRIINPIFRAITWADYDIDRVLRTDLIGAGEVIIPAGRAESLPEELLTKYSKCQIKFKPHKEELMIDPKGDVYLCCAMMPFAIGNAIKSPLEEIVGNARENPDVQALISGGPKELAKRYGFYDPGQEEAYDNNQCTMCIRLSKMLSSACLTAGGKK